MKTTIALVTAIGITLMAPAFATPISGTIEIANSFSMIHAGSNPSGVGDREDWHWFDAGQRINLILENGMLSLNGQQAFSLNVPSDPEAAALVTFTELSIDLNAADGFAGGYLDYTLDGVSGTFSFPDDQFGNSQFNSSSWAGNQLSVYAWGGDIQNELGIDIVFKTPEPGVVALFLLGLAGVIILRRRPLRVGTRA